MGQGVWELKFTIASAPNNNEALCFSRYNNWRDNLYAHVYFGLYDKNVREVVLAACTDWNNNCDNPDVYAILDQFGQTPTE
jgi:hypothetical protein